jgi:Protein of unknown function (DUF3592)
MGELSTSQLQDLTKTILKDRDPNTRKEALLEIRKSNHPQVLELLQHVSAKDKDRSVRDLAGNLLTRKKIQGIQEPASPASQFAPPKTASRPSSHAQTWTCNFCRQENMGGETCVSCGAVRATNAQRSGAPPRAKIQPDDVFLMIPDNRAFLEGKTQHLSSATKAVGCLLIFLIPFVLIGLVAIGWAVSSWYSWNAINQSGIPGTGEIVDKQISSGDDSDTYYVSYAYTHAETSYTHKQSVDWDTYQNAEIGAQVSIKYVPSNPNIASLANKNNPPYFIAGFSLLWNLAVWSVLIGLLVSRSRDNLLAKEGQLIPGEIMTSRSLIEGEDNDFYLKVEYAFRAPVDGRLITGHSKTQRNDLRNGTLPGPGSPLAILYRNDTHHKPL